MMLIFWGRGPKTSVVGSADIVTKQTWGKDAGITGLVRNGGLDIDLSGQGMSIKL
jgi:hypothetical protein